MESIYKQYKPTITFILKFSLTYLILVLLYNFYISSFNGKTDNLTLFVGRMVSHIYELLGVDAQTVPLTDESGLKLIIKGKYLARIVEGCTAVSIIIMFAAFVISFGKRLKFTALFAIIGSVSIFVFNIIRIVLLGYILLIIPKWQDFSHRVLFPALIYGFVVLLWVIFIKKQSNE